MKPDIYRIRNPASPTTALAAWMSFAGHSRNRLADATDVSRDTVGKAMAGFASEDESTLRPTSAKEIARYVHMEPIVVLAGEKRVEWTFRLHANGRVVVVEPKA